MEIKYKETVTTFGEIPIGELFRLTRPLTEGVYIKAVDAFEKRYAVNIKNGRILMDINQNDEAVLVRGIIIIDGSVENKDSISENLREQKKIIWRKIL